MEKCISLAPDNQGVQKAHKEVLAQWEEAKREEAVASRASKLMDESSLLDIDEDEPEATESEQPKSDTPTPAAKGPEGEAPVNDLVAVQTEIKALASADQDSAVEALVKLQWLLVSDDDNRIHFRSQDGFQAVLPWLPKQPQEALGVFTNACLNEKNVAVLREAGPASSPHQPIKDILALLSHEDKRVQYAASLCIAVCSESGERSRVVISDCGAGKALCSRLADMPLSDTTAPHVLAL